MQSSDTPAGSKRGKLRGRELYRARTVSSLLRLATRLQLHKQLPGNTTLGRLRMRQRIKELNKQLKSSRDADSIDFNNTIGSYDISSVNSLASPPRGKVKYTKRQLEFTWLNTHVWHAKRAHMIKRWGWQIPLQPTQKCFRSSHRAFNLDGAVVWDKSFIGTCIIQGDNEASIVELVNQVIVGKKWTKLKSDGLSINTMVESDDDIIGEITIIAFQSPATKRCVIRAHPSIYTEVFNLLVSKRTEDVEIVDCRYALGSIEITGPVALSSLATVLKPVDPSSANAQIFKELCCQTNLPDKTMFTLMIQDPRLANRTKPSQRSNADPLDSLIRMKATRENLDQFTIEALLTSKGRMESYKDQKSLKQVQVELNRPVDERQPGKPIPVMLFNNDGVWTVLVPWFWTLPIWHALVHIAHVKLGGLKQTHQLKFESGKLFFPVDFPFTQVGELENKLNADVKREKWAKKPKGKRVNYDSIKIGNSRGEVGDPFGCDWRYLQVLRIALPHVTNNRSISRTSVWNEQFQRKIEELHDVYNLIEDVKQSKVNKLSKLPIRLSSAVEYPSTIESPLPVTTINVTTLSRGSIGDNARLYSIPTEDLSEWLSTIDSKHTNGRKNHESYPQCPSPQHLVGFITSGTYNLHEGHATGVGCVDSVWTTRSERYLLLRNVGVDVVRLVTWEAVDALKAMRPTRR